MSDPLLPAPLGALAAWGSTFLLHSTLFFAIAWLLERSGRPRRLPTRETLWRLVLFGGLASSLAQVGWTREPWLGRHALPVGWTSELPGARTHGVEEHGTPSAGVARGTPVATSLEVAPVAPARSPDGLARDRASTAPTSSGPLDAIGGGPWPWLLASAAALLLLGMPRWRLMRWLGQRRELLAGPVVDELLRLRPRRRPRITVSERLVGPISLGILRPEICLPRRALELDPALLRAMLAHELAHLERRDPLWFALTDGACRLLWFQPLLRRARARTLELAELACDQWAARRTGDPLALASCLAEVAGWLRARHHAPTTCAMARPGSRLGRRVRRLLDHAVQPHGERSTRAGWIAAVGSVCVATAALPALALVPEPSRPARLGLSTAPIESAGRAHGAVFERRAPGVARALAKALAEVDAGMRATEQRLDALRAKSLSGDERLLLDQLAARSTQLAGRREALESDLRSRHGLGSASLPPPVTR